MIGSNVEVSGVAVVGNRENVEVAVGDRVGTGGVIIAVPFDLTNGTWTPLATATHSNARTAITLEKYMVKVGGVTEKRPKKKREKDKKKKK